MQMLLRSRALEISVEGCVWTPAPPGGEVLLADVLRAFLDPGLSPSVPALLASKVTELSGVLAHEGQATRSAATAALAALVAALKAPHERPAASVSSRPQHSKQTPPAETKAALAAVDSELAAQQAALARAATARDRAQTAKRVLALADRRLELVAGADGGGAVAGGTNAAAVQTAIRDLSAWTSVIGREGASVMRASGATVASRIARHRRAAAHRTDVATLSTPSVNCGVAGFREGLRLWCLCSYEPNGMFTWSTESLKPRLAGLQAAAQTRAGRAAASRGGG